MGIFVGSLLLFFRKEIEKMTKRFVRTYFLDKYYDIVF